MKDRDHNIKSVKNLTILFSFAIFDALHNVDEKLYYIFYSI